jgi:ABC-2 type transport system ATP-binding protein
MQALSIQHINKEYGDHKANDDISLDIEKGKIFGLLGPNGAGKTTLIRIITRIIRQDSGEIEFMGRVMEANDRYAIGYMPEERGLYKKMKVGEQLLYIARLKGLSKRDAHEKIDYWLNRLDIQDWRNKKVEELSKGMQQKIQFIATVLHDPDLLILDEPFSGLDPINANLLKDEIDRLNEQGKTIIFSTHRMEQVEAICEDIALISKGQVVLQGPVEALKQRFKKNIFFLKFEGEISEAFKVKYNPTALRSGEVQIQLEEGMDSNEMLRTLVKEGIKVNEFREILPSLNEIFIDQVQNPSHVA